MYYIYMIKGMGNELLERNKNLQDTSSQGLELST